jgi:putative hydrolase of the HAD superfamily
MQLAPEDVWMVGDNLEWDVAGAQAVGITGIWVDFLSKGLPESGPVQPDRIIYSITQLAGDV